MYLLITEDHDEFIPDLADLLYTIAVAFCWLTIIKIEKVNYVENCRLRLQEALISCLYSNLHVGKLHIETMGLGYFLVLFFFLFSFVMTMSWWASASQS